MEIRYPVVSWINRLRFAVVYAVFRRPVEKHLDLAPRWVLEEGSADSFPVRANSGRLFTEERRGGAFFMLQATGLLCEMLWQHCGIASYIPL